jgi:2-keto-3-deoxy-L-rhamnonate aldolase RhmA
MTTSDLIGIWQFIPSTAISRYLTRAGWQWIVLDMQHGPMTWETAYECIHIIRAAGATAWVRVSIGQPSEVQRALDLGAQGVVVPMVNSQQEAQKMAAAAKYPPLGERSVGGDLATQFGSEYYDRANQETILAVQIEHIDAVNEVEAIMAVEGVDACFVGPTDLAMSMGLPRTGFEGDASHQQAIRRTASACLQAGKLACCNTYSLEDFRQKRQLGYQGLTFMSEADLLKRSSQGLIKQLREGSKV